MAHFNVVVRGVLSSGGNVSARVYRNGEDTLTATTITEVETGYYVVTFEVPADWDAGDNVAVSFEVEVEGRLARSVKVVSNLESPLSELLDADQVRDGNFIRYYRRGTNQSELIGTQVQSGDPCSDQTSLIWQ